MIEFDSDAYSRKWRSSTAIVKVDGHRQAVYISDVLPYSFPDMSRGTVFTLSGGSTLYAVNKRVEGMSTIETEYFPFEAGVYVDKRTSQYFCVLWRKHRKSYVNGLYMGANWSNVTVDKETGDYTDSPRVTNLEYFVPLPKHTITAEGAGWLSKRIWYRQDQIFFLNSQIGMKEGKTFMVNENMVPLIQPLLDEECQIKVL